MQLHIHMFEYIYYDFIEQQLTYFKAEHVELIDKISRYNLYRKNKKQKTCPRMSKCVERVGLHTAGGAYLPEHIQDLGNNACL